jgi:hypothetical protein
LVSLGLVLVKKVFLIELISRAKVFVPESIDDSHQSKTSCNNYKALKKTSNFKLRSLSLIDILVPYFQWKTFAEGYIYSGNVLKPENHFTVVGKQFNLLQVK